jgi:hypothetical protein
MVGFLCFEGLLWALQEKSRENVRHAIRHRRSMECAWKMRRLPVMRVALLVSLAGECYFFCKAGGAITRASDKGAARLMEA